MPNDTSRSRDPLRIRQVRNPASGNATFGFVFGTGASRQAACARQPTGSADETEGDPGPPAPDNSAKRQLGQRVATQLEPGPEHGRQECESRQTPRPENIGQADRGARDAGGVEGQVAQGCDQHEAKRGQRVGEERGPELRRSAEKRDDHESRNMQRRYNTQGTDPLDSRDGPRITDLS
jgi:hypothetical protein